MLAAAAKQVTVGAEYMHYKQQRYQVTGLAVLESTSEVCVLYQALYGDYLNFVRPLADWLATVEWEGRVISRFSEYND